MEMNKYILGTPKGTPKSYWVPLNITETIILRGKKYKQR